VDSWYRLFGVLPVSAFIAFGIGGAVRLHVPYRVGQPTRGDTVAFWSFLIAWLVALGGFSWLIYEAATMEIPGSF
jgi:hypothetical protein